MLKHYQHNALEALREFIDFHKDSHSLSNAYEKITENNFDGKGIYNNSCISNIPYICIRIPTGGGKTLLASHSIPLINKDFLLRQFSLVIWLVPSTAILEQTIQCLQDVRHPYRTILNENFDGNVEVLRIDDAKYLTREVLQYNTVIIVSTYASWRVDKTEGRKVYDNNGALSSHFENIPEWSIEKLEYLEIGEERVLKHSLANVVFLNNPIFIIDEAHNARTTLTFEVLKRLNPSFIIEFTATPKMKGIDRSNVIYSASASQLKAEDMIKMPIELTTANEWQVCLSNAINKQKDLERLSMLEEIETGEYIRPIVLIQTQNDNKNSSTINIEVVKSFLINSGKISDSQIAIATGTEMEIAGINLLARNCEIRFILTKQALKEGWDCPFAYVFCSVAAVSSSKDVEQLLGRVLRMPSIKRKNHSELNLAYAFVSSASFYQTASNLQDSLTNSGFSKIEASEFIIANSVQQSMSEFFDNIILELIDPIDENLLSVDLKPKVEFNNTDNKLTLKGAFSPYEKAGLISIVKNDDDKRLIESALLQSNIMVRRKVSPNEHGYSFEVPQLLINFGTEIRVFDEDILLPSNWNLANCDFTLSSEEFPVKIDAGTRGLIDIDKSGRVFSYSAVTIKEELSSVLISQIMDKKYLLRWLVNECRSPLVTFPQTLSFVSALVDDLLISRSLKTDHIVFLRYKLRDAIKEKISSHIKVAKNEGYQRLLFDNENLLNEIFFSFNLGLPFKFPSTYPANSIYQGYFNFTKHFYNLVGDLNDEEAECALNIDTHNNVDYWVRNIERNEMSSFWLQTSTDKFYPDFIVKLKNDKIVIVEYKGFERYDLPDSIEKRRIGDFYSSLSPQEVRFIMVRGKDWNKLNDCLDF